MDVLIIFDMLGIEARTKGWHSGTLPLTTLQVRCLLMHCFEEAQDLLLRALLNWPRHTSGPWRDAGPAGYRILCSAAVVGQSTGMFIVLCCVRHVHVGVRVSERCSVHNHMTQC